MPQALSDLVFDLALDHGRCVGVQIPEDVDAADALGAAALVSEERAFAAGLPPVRRRTWIAGRVAMRAVLARLDLDAPAILADGRGAPVLPRGIAGSISHKNRLAVALVSASPGPHPAAPGPPACVGVDVENDIIGKIDISSQVLAADEVQELAALAPDAHAREVLLRFSAKEAIYKALDPFVHRFVSFQEVSVSPDPGGGARVAARLRGGEGPFSFEARWRRFDGIVLTSARVARAAPSTRGPLAP